MPRAAWHRVHSRLLSTWPGPRTICPDQLFPARKSPPPPSSLPCCSTARRITLHLELTHLGRSSARFGGRISVSASLFPPACSPLAGDGSAGCRRRRAGGRASGKLGQDCLSLGCPMPGLPALPWHFPVGAHAPWQGGLPLCPQQWLAGQGGLAPCSFVCVWLGGGRPCT